jgi:putative Mg2+ transporter-C (MgtC) family protein
MFEYALRLFLSAILGGVIGTEREKRDKAAGIRTYALVAVTSCLIMLTSYNLAMDLGDEKAYADAARIAAQVVSGVGFLGAGTILKNDNKIRGLTTAAGLWSVAGIGLAVGMGYYFIAIITAIIIVITLAYI